MLSAPWFALAGLVAAAGPVLIHLLNRQRYRVVEWAAMDFLRQAIRRSRRIVRLRDLLLLALRTLCVLLFGLAMARPYFAAGSARVNPNEPVHAILLMDNSLSMGYKHLDGTLLDHAKARAKAFCERLPPGSRISVLPLCGSAAEFSLDAYRTTQDALEALAAIEPVDRSATAAGAIDLALEACRRTPSPPSKQVLLLSDQQAANWPASPLSAQLSQLPGTLQVVQVSPDEIDNAWVADFSVQDGLADLGTPAVFLATIRYEGRLPREDVEVTLAVDGMTIAAQTVDLQPGQAREIRFPPYEIDVPVEPGRAAFVAAEVSIPHDRLPADDARFLIVPVVAAVPVVFVDQYGPDEDPARNRFGETYRLRRLLAPVTSRGGDQRQPIEVRHVRADQLDRGLLADARLVVMAGLADPPDAVPLLREYVEQGGSLVIAAGGDFDPAAWTATAWADGLGILPAPLKPDPVGRLPGASQSGPIEPFQLDADSLVHEYFQLEQTSDEELKDLYTLPYFFKAVEADLSEEVLNEIARTAAARLERDHGRLAEAQKRLDELATKEAEGALSEADQRQREKWEAVRAEIAPQWLLWEPPESRQSRVESREPEGSQLSSRDSQLSALPRPRVLGTFSNGVPFMIERRMGRGQVLFVSTGVFRDWNTLTTTNAVLVFDRIFRRLLQQTLPERNVATTGQITVAVPGEYRHARFALRGPEGEGLPLSVEALGGGRYGVHVEDLARRGHYRLTAQATDDTPQAAPGARLWEVVLAANGPADESHLRLLNQDDLAERMADAPYRWVDRQEAIDLAGAAVRGRDLWRWLMAAVLAGLLVEMVMVSRRTRFRESLEVGSGRWEARTPSLRSPASSLSQKPAGTVGSEVR